MKVIIFDPFSGASGDMIMGSLLDLGADAAQVRKAVESVGCELEISREGRGHIMATRARVISDRRYHDLDEAVSILTGSCLPGEAKQKALRALDALASAEGRVHGIHKEKAHFHEIGALDALADMAGSFAAMESLRAAKVFSLPLSVGAGTISSLHGLLPVPAPAVLEILRNFRIPWKGGPVDQELLTPTGAAILAAGVDGFLAEYPSLKAEQVGYGAGSRSISIPNVLRSVKGEMRHSYHKDQVVLLETNVDDVTGEVLGNLIELLMDAGALDVTVLPAVMKKGRSGNVIKVIARHYDLERLAGLVMRETGTLGLRVFPTMHRFLAEREALTVEAKIMGTIFRAQVKVSRLQGAVLNVKPEYEDCRKIAQETGLPLRRVMQKVEEEGRRLAGLQ